MASWMSWPDTSADRLMSMMETWPTLSSTVCSNTEGNTIARSRFRFSGFAHALTNCSAVSRSQLTWLPSLSTRVKSSIASRLGSPAASSTELAVRLDQAISSPVPNFRLMPRASYAPLTAISEAALPLSVMFAIAPSRPARFDRCMAAGPSAARKSREKSMADCRFFSRWRELEFWLETASRSCDQTRLSAASRWISAFVSPRNWPAFSENSVIAVRCCDDGSSCCHPPFVTLGSTSATSRLHAVYGASFARSWSLTNRINVSTSFAVNSCCMNRWWLFVRVSFASRYISWCMRSVSRWYSRFRFSPASESSVLTPERHEAIRVCRNSSISASAGFIVSISYTQRAMWTSPSAVMWYTESTAESGIIARNARAMSGFWFSICCHAAADLVLTLRRRAASCSFVTPCRSDSEVWFDESPIRPPTLPSFQLIFALPACSSASVIAWYGEIAVSPSMSST